MNKLRYALYMRKSTEEAERQMLSLDSQRDKIFERYGDLNIVAEFRESKSAAEPFKRPKFREMLDRIDAGEIDGIVAWHPDRLSRNEMDAAEIGFRTRKGIIKDLKFVSGVTFENTPEGIMMLQFTMAQSQHYSAKLSKDVKRGNEKKRQMGGLTGQAPEGYINVRTSLTGRGEATVERDPERFPLMRKAFDLFLTGEYSVQSIHTIMTDEWGYKTAVHGTRGGKAIMKNTLYNTFRNIRYAGLVPDPYDSDKFYKANFPAMITMEEYDKVQVLLGRKGMPRLTSRKQFALRGFIRCGECNCMITSTRKTKTLASGKQAVYDYYHCTGKRKCTQRSNYVKEVNLWSQLLELLDNYELSPKLYDWAMEAFREFAEQEVVERNSVQNTQQGSIAGIQTQLDRLLDMATRGLIDDEQYRIKCGSLKSELLKLQEAQADTNDRVKNWYEIATETFEKLTYAGDKFKTGDVGNKKDVLLAIGRNPTLIDGKLGITPHEWLIPVVKETKRIRNDLDMVRTMPLQIQKASEEAIHHDWWGWIELNYLPSGYEPPALTDELQPRRGYYSLVVHPEL